MSAENETRVALIGIIVQNPDSVEELNQLLHAHRSAIIGRMGMPHREKNLSVISIVLDAPIDEVSALAGKIGMLDGVSSKTIFPKMD